MGQAFGTQPFGTQPEKLPEDVATTLVIAHHNVAVQREHLREWDQAALAYKEGCEIAQRTLGTNRPLTSTLSQNCSAVIQKSPKKRLGADVNAMPIASPASPGTSPGESPQTSPKKRFVSAPISPGSSS